MSAEIVKLNVGGKWFSTTRTTLFSKEGSIFQDMLLVEEHHSGDHPGYYFIDRDGELFRYILNYLRSGELTCPKNFTEHEQLAKEAEFYRLYELASDIAKRGRTRRSVDFVEVVEVAHPEKLGLCCARLTLTEEQRRMSPFAERLVGEREEVDGTRGRLWVRSSITRLDWGEILASYGWVMCGSVAYVRKIPDVTGYGTDMTHVLDKWMLKS